jgi:hypothetical protein
VDEKMRRAQVTLWIVLAIVLVASLILFFMLSKTPEPIIVQGGETGFEIENFLESCVKENVEDVVEIILPQGGFVSPGNFVYFDNKNIEYMCKHDGYYDPCIQQHPLLLREIRKEIRTYLLPRVNDCLVEVQEDIEGKGGEVIFGRSTDIEVDMGPDRIFVRLIKDMTISREGESRDFNGFDFVINDPTYNLANVAMEISAQEAKYCYFEYVGYHILYPRYEIREFEMSEPTTIYSIKDVKTEKEMNIAVRGCAIPPGF